MIIPFKALMVTLICLILTACTTITPVTQLKENEGIVLINADCDHRAHSLIFYVSGSNSEWMIDLSKGGRGLSVFCYKSSPRTTLVKLPAGDYFLGRVGATDTAGWPKSLVYNEEEAYKFTVEANKINYIGDFKVDTSKKFSGTRTDRRKIYVAVNVSDNFRNSTKDLTAEQLEVFEKYEHRKGIAKK